MNKTILHFMKTTILLSILLLGFTNKAFAQLTPVKMENKWGYENADGEMVIPATYEMTWGFSEGLAAIKLNGRFGFIDETGKVVIPAKYDWTEESFNQGLVGVFLNNSFGFIDKTGKEVVPIKYNWQRAKKLKKEYLSSKM